VCAAVLTLEIHIGAQDRLKTMPGFEQFERMSRELPTAVQLGAIAPVWSPDGASFEYVFAGKQYRFDVASRHASAIGDAPAGAERFGRGARVAARAGRGRGRGDAPARGRQFESADAPDGTLKAFYKDRNVWIGHADGSDAVAITTDGSERDRVKYGTASWVYGEELGQRTAMWWSPDSRRLAYYRFDESGVPDYYLQMHQTDVQDALDVEAYPKPGKPNPVVDLFVYDIVSKKTTKIDVRGGRPFENDTIGYYVWDVEWTKDGKELLALRANRRQNAIEVAACDPAAGACRTVLHEAWPTGWISDERDWRFLEDGRRFIWSSERNGWKNYYLYDLSGRLVAPLTNHTTCEASSIVFVDEPNAVFYYMARDGDSFLKPQLHRVGFDGRNDRRLTDPAFAHTITPSPDGKYFVDVAETHDAAPVSRLLDADGKIVAPIASSDVTKLQALGFRPSEMFAYKAADGKTSLSGLIHFPSHFDPSHKYPVLVPVYGGPASASNTATERYSLPAPLAEYGFLVVNLNSRATPGMGKRALDALYLKLGQTEIDDMAEGARALCDRPYVDCGRIGIYGTSYGGYTAVMEILRHPEVFAAASASSPPTDWRNYDTIYTERYMGLPDENRAGYDAGSAMTYAEKLKGRLLLYYGTSDNNVHPANSLQLIKALQAAGRSFDVQVGPDQGHSGVNQQRMMEFFIENLIMRPSPDLSTAPSGR
jgi:dipeptidyl-peptidase-4